MARWHHQNARSARLPAFGVADSLNAGHAAALLLYESLDFK